MKYDMYVFKYMSYYDMTIICLKCMFVSILRHFFNVDSLPHSLFSCSSLIAQLSETCLVIVVMAFRLSHLFLSRCRPVSKRKLSLPSARHLQFPVCQSLFVNAIFLTAMMPFYDFLLCDRSTLCSTDAWVMSSTKNRMPVQQLCFSFLS